MIPLLQAGDDSRKNWRKINELGLTLAAAKLPSQSQAEKLAGLVGRGRDPEVHFQIYRGSTWLKFKVATGPIITTDEPFAPTGIDTEITVASGVARHWFYLDITPTSASVQNSATTEVWSVSKVPIGYVDTATYAASSRSLITQLVRDFIFVPCVSEA